MRSRSRLPNRLLRPLRNEDGATLVFFALIVMVLLGTFALAVDVGAALNARSEAQRTADAAALAGAGLFRSLASEYTPDVIAPLARDTAERFATLNSVGWTMVEETDVNVTVWPNDRKVGVEIEGSSPLFFAPFLGVVSLPVRAYAEARVMGSATVDCVKPFAMPDLWQSGTAPSVVYNHDEDSHWAGGFNPARGDRYEKWDGTLTHSTATGFGAPVRNNVTNWQGHSYMHDNGRKVVFKIGSHDHDPLSSEVPIDQLNQSHHFLLDMGSDRTPIPGVNCNSGNPVTRNICQCNNSQIGIGSQVQKEPGNVANTAQGIDRLIQADPNLSWDDVNKRVVNQHGETVTESPRIVKMVLYDPTTASTESNGMLDVANIGLFFIEQKESQGNNVNMIGRFLMFASGSGVGGGTTALSLQLVK